MTGLEPESSPPLRPTMEHIEQIRLPMRKALEHVEPANPMLTASMSAAALDYLAPGETAPARNAHGQPIVQLHRVKIFSYSPLEILKANAEIDPSKIEMDQLRRFVGGAIAIPAPEEILHMGIRGVAGFTRGPDGAPRPHLLHDSPWASPLRCAVASLLGIRDRSWSNGTYAAVSQPFICSPGTTVVPFIGDLWMDGELVDAQVLASAGICRAAVRRKTDGTERPADDEESESLLGSYPVFLQGGRSIIIPAAGSLPAVSTPEGGVRIVTDLAELKALKADKGTDGKSKLRPLSIVAVQYVGVGISRYLYHNRPCDSTGRVTLTEHEIIIDTSDRGTLAAGTAAIVQDTRYAGESGIFLDVQHQATASTPTGALEKGEDSARTDEQLLRYGARLSSITLGSVPLVRRADLEREANQSVPMTAEQIEVAYRIVLDDTLRLDTFVPLHTDPAPTHTASLNQFLKEMYGEVTDACRSHYLETVHTNVAINLRVCARLGLTIGKYQPTADNLSVYGRIADAENFVREEPPYALVRLVYSWVANLKTLAGVAGIPAARYLQSPHFQSLGTRSGAQLLGSVHHTQPPEMQLRCAAIDLTVGLLRAEWDERAIGIGTEELLREAERGGMLTFMLKSSEGSHYAPALRAARSGEKLIVNNGIAGGTFGIVTGTGAEREVKRALELQYLRTAATRFLPGLTWGDRIEETIVMLEPSASGFNA